MLVKKSNELHSVHVLFESLVVEKFSTIYFSLVWAQKTFMTHLERDAHGSFHYDSLPSSNCSIFYLCVSGGLQVVVSADNCEILHYMNKAKSWEVYEMKRRKWCPSYITSTEQQVTFLVQASSIFHPSSYGTAISENLTVRYSWVI